MRNLIVRETLIFASVGLSFELLIVLLLGFGSRTDFIFPVGVSIVGPYLAAILLGILFGTILDRKPPGKSRFFIGGMLVAWLCLIVQALFGSSVEYLRNSDQLDAFWDYIFKPFFWIVFLGTIPAIAIGALYSVRIKMLYARIEKVP